MPTHCWGFRLQLSLKYPALFHWSPKLTHYTSIHSAEFLNQMKKRSPPESGITHYNLLGLTKTPGNAGETELITSGHHPCPRKHCIVGRMLFLLSHCVKEEMQASHIDSIGILYSPGVGKVYQLKLPSITIVISDGNRSTVPLRLLINWAYRNA